MHEMRVTCVKPYDSTQHLDIFLRLLQTIKIAAISSMLYCEHEDEVQVGVQECAGANQYSFISFRVINSKTKMLSELWSL